MSLSIEVDGSFVLQTRSGSEYVVEGRSVRRIGEDGEQSFTFISLGDHRLRYTDGAWIYVSSEVVSRQAA